MGLIDARKPACVPSAFAVACVSLGSVSGM